MAAVRMLVRTELRRRWKALLALTLLLGVAGGATLTAVAGARRTSTAFDRFVEDTKASDVTLAASQSDKPNALAAERLDEVERLPQVEVFGRIAAFYLLPKGFDPNHFGLVASVDGNFGTTVEVGRVVAGRRADPRATDELVVGEQAAATIHLEVGDRVPVRSVTPEDFGNPAAEAKPSGPRLVLRVVGILRLPNEVAATGQCQQCLGFLTPGFFRTYRDRIVNFEGSAFVRLVGGSEDLPRFTAAVGDIYDNDVALTFESAEVARSQVDDQLGVVSSGLLLVSLVIGLAGFVWIMQAIRRQLLLALAQQRPLRALGASRALRCTAVFLPVGAVALVGGAIAVGAAVAASPLMPIGLARRVETDPGLAVDGLVLGAGLVATVVLVAGAGLIAAWYLVRSTDAEDGGPPKRVGSRLAMALARRGARPPVVVGARLALEPGRGATAVPARSALAGAVLGVGGLVAALVFGASLTRLLDTPSRYGWNWDAGVIGVFSRAELMQTTPSGTSLTGVVFDDVEIEGRPIKAIGIEPDGIPLTIVEGRTPRARDEVVLGSETLSRLEPDHDVGETVDVSASGRSRSFHIVGRALFPSAGRAPVPLADGIGFTRAGLHALALEEAEQDDGSLVRFPPGTDRVAALRRLRSTFGLETLSAQRPPPEIVKLEDVERLPIVVAGLLGLLAVLAAAHALVMTVRRRRRELAVLRVLGFSSGQIRAAIAWQASLQGVFGILVGVPLGFIAGRLAWAAVANGLGVANDTAVPVLALLLTLPVALIVANALAALPGRAAARMHPATVLRSE